MTRPPRTGLASSPRAHENIPVGMTRSTITAQNGTSATAQKMMNRAAYRDRIVITIKRRGRAGGILSPEPRNRDQRSEKGDPIRADGRGDLWVPRRAPLREMKHVAADAEIVLRDGNEVRLQRREELRRNASSTRATICQGWVRDWRGPRKSAAANPARATAATITDGCMFCQPTRSGTAIASLIRNESSLAQRPGTPRSMPERDFAVGDRHWTA